MLHGMPAQKTQEGWLIQREVLEVFMQTRAARHIVRDENTRPRASNGD
jgi:hypothetical protein